MANVKIITEPRIKAGLNSIPNSLARNFALETKSKKESNSSRLLA